MCGIIGYVGANECAPILIDGLSKLEYRGYDSAGVAVVGPEYPDDFTIRRTVGKLSNLRALLETEPVSGHVGIGHTRWATHGRPTQVNAHPHRYGHVVVVHNGIIENHLELRRALEQRGHAFTSETDSEIFAHLVDERVVAGQAFPEAVRLALQDVLGSYAIAMLSTLDPETIVVAKSWSPLVLGIGDGERFVASDIPAVLSSTRSVVFLEDGEMAVLHADRHRIYRIADGAEVEHRPQHISWSAMMAEKGGYKHFMLKEIHEQPRAVTDTIRGRISVERGDVFFEDVTLTPEILRDVRRMSIIACGTSWHAGMVGKYFIEQMARLPVQVDLASEFRYRDPVIDAHDLVLVISQSGETADTIAALREATSRGARAAAIVNVVGSTIARMATDVIYTHAGPEIGVASTKAFTTQLTVLYLLAVQLGRLRGMLDAPRASERIAALTTVPALMEDAVRMNEPGSRDVARCFVQAHSSLFLGRGAHFPIALEGALKLKEISYVHAEGYAAGEMKHGPIALVDDQVPVVVIAPRGPGYDKTLSNLQEIRARNGRVYAVGHRGDEQLAAQSDDILPVPESDPLVAPLLTVVPLQLLAYHVADLKGTDVDQPRNLAKSVTVE